MRILFFSTAFPQPYEPSRNPDNLERCVALSRQHPVRVMSPYSWLHLGSAIESDDHLSSRGLLVDRPLVLLPTRRVSRRARVVHVAGDPWRCSQTRTDVSTRCGLSYWTYPDTAVATAVARLARIPCVTIVGGSDVLSIDRRHLARQDDEPGACSKPSMGSRP
jgi:hypothetical protein